MCEDIAPEIRECLAGAYDLHVHPGPDLIERRFDDFELEARFSAQGLGGFVIKNHYCATADRAALVRKMSPTVDVIGAIVLNHEVGGINARAVEALARAGGQIVWMPTTDASSEGCMCDRWDRSEWAPPYVHLQWEIQARNLSRPPITVLNEAGKISAATHEVLEVIAFHGLTLATGHLSAAEVVKLAAAAASAGISKIIVTHPESPKIALDSAVRAELLSFEGLRFEHVYAYLLHLDIWESTAAEIKRLGPERFILSTDGGGTKWPYPDESLADMARRFLDLGISVPDIRQMTVHNQRQLISKDGM